MINIPPQSQRYQIDRSTSTKPDISDSIQSLTYQTDGHAPQKPNKKYQTDKRVYVTEV